MNKLPKNACVYPFKGAMLMHGVPATPCCRFHTRFLDESDKADINTYDATFANIRETMMRNEWHPGCYKCRADEESKGSSMRTEADEFFRDFDDVNRLEYLEITVGRLCNLACISCGPEFSHTWDKDAIALGIDSEEKIAQLKKDQEYDLDNLDLDTLQNLKHIKVTGGEPFLHKQFLRLIIRLAESGLARRIDLEIFTNCTWYPQKVEYDALAEFRKVRINPSIDGVGATNDLIRYPSKFEKIEETLDKWIEMRDSFRGKVHISTATTVSVINAPQMWEFMHWARVAKGIDVVLQTVYEPNHMSIIHWPQWYKEMLDYTIEQQFAGFNNKAGKYQPAYKLLKKLCATPSEGDNSEFYIAQLRAMFEHRGQRLEDAHKFYEMIKYHDRQR